MNTLAMLALAWLCANTQFPKCQEVDLPTISWHYNSQLIYTKYNIVPHKGTNIYLYGIYLHEAKRLMLNKDLKEDEIYLQRTMIHEMYHHLQIINDGVPKCLAELELPAYEITNKFANEFGLSVEEIPFGVYINKARCSMSTYDEMIDEDWDNQP